MAGGQKGRPGGQAPGATAEGVLYRVRLGGFEGPLDLFLRLVEEGEYDLARLPLAAMARQILATVRQEAPLDLGPAGQTLAVAAGLVRRKVKALLPPDPEDLLDEEPGEDGDGEGADPEAELQRRLEEYLVFKRVAEELAAMREVRAHCFPRFPQDPFGTEGEAAAAKEGAGGAALQRVDGAALARAFRDLLARRKPGIPVESLPRRALSLSAAVARITAHVRDAGGRIPFTSLFRPDEGRAVWIVVFLALLELLRRGRVDIYQEGAFGPIWVQAVPGGAGAPLAQGGA